MTRIKLIVATLALVLLPGCAIIKPVARTVDKLAQDACAQFFSEQMGLSFRDAAKAYCDTREKLDPFVEAILAAQQVAGSQSAGLQGVTLPDGE